MSDPTTPNKARTCAWAGLTVHHSLWSALGASRVVVWENDPTGRVEFDEHPRSNDGVSVGYAHELLVRARAELKKSSTPHNAQDIVEKAIVLRGEDRPARGLHSLAAALNRVAQGTSHRVVVSATLEQIARLLPTEEE